VCRAGRTARTPEATVARATKAREGPDQGAGRIETGARATSSRQLRGLKSSPEMGGRQGTSYKLAPVTGCGTKGTSYKLAPDEAHIRFKTVRL
jgi:hypothetical protein